MDKYGSWAEIEKQHEKDKKANVEQLKVIQIIKNNPLLQPNKRIKKEKN